jgi:16S rRNA (cytosine1402-N4)-methyltransferase
MDRSQDLTADHVVNGYDEQRLESLLRGYADERHARRIARAIMSARPIRDTAHLSDVVVAAIPAPARRTGGHPAKRTFQAIRIEVNGELDALPAALRQAIDATSPGGRIAVLSYHSGEDRIVAGAFADAERASPPDASPFVHPDTVRMRVRRVRAPRRPSQAELERNPRASAAKLRVVEKVGR